MALAYGIPPIPAKMLADLAWKSLYSYRARADGRKTFSRNTRVRVLLALLSRQHPEQYFGQCQLPDTEMRVLVAERIRQYPLSGHTLGDTRMRVRVPEGT